MASSRRTGTNENISTYGAGGMGRDYTVLATWEAATDYNLVTATTSEILECYDDAASFDDYMTMSGATCNASYRRIVRPAAGQGHDGTPNNGFTISSTTDAPLIRVDENYSQVQDIIASLTINSANNRLVFGGTGNHVGFIGCIAYDSDNTGSGTVSGFWVWGTANFIYIVNCLAHNIENIGCYVQGGCGGIFYCCTVTDCNIGFDEAVTTGVAVAKNCVPSGNGTNWNGSWSRVACVTDGSVPSYVDSANDDFHILSSDTVCRGFGTNLSADGTYSFDDDIDFDSRPFGVSWDIGFDEYVLYPNTDIQPNITIMI